jgi:phosphoribosyl 1,2-cyclic phosphodiesterase
MTLHTINTGSEGNCYILTSSNGESLILEAGMKLSCVKKALNFDISGVIACIVSHRHGDHAKYVKSFSDAGISIIANEEVYKFTGITPDWNIINSFRNQNVQVIGDWKILSFPVIHDVLTHGFLINHPESGNILFATDTMDLPYTFPNLSQIIIEANFSERILSVMNEKHKDYYVNQRVRTSHLSLEKCHNFLKSNDLTNVQNIVLIHLSARNSDMKEFEKSTMKLTGKPVFISQPNQTINLDKSIF